MEIIQPTIIDLLDTPGTPALSSTSDVPVVETKPDALNEGAPPAATEEPVKTESESATDPESQSASDEPKKAKGVQKRLDELTRQREAEARRAEAAEAREARLLALLEEKQKPAPKTEDDPEPARPAREGMDEEAYVTALMDYAEQKAAWTARREVKAAQAEVEQKQQLSEAEKAQQVVREAYAARIETVKGKYPDFDDVANTPDVQVSIPMAAAILHSENGPELQYYLGKNPQEAERIFRLSPPLQLLELGKIEAKLLTPQPKPVSAAPAPIKPLAGATGTASKSREEMSMEEYAAIRKKELREQVRH